MENQQNIEVQSLRKKLNFFVVLSVILIIVCAVLLWKTMSYNQEVQTITIEKQTADTEKAALVDKLTKLQEEYDKLGEQYTNLDSMFVKERDKVTSLIEKIKNLKGSVSKYKGKVGILEGRLQEYMAQIEELKAKNLALTEENFKIKTAYDSTVTENTELSSKNTELSAKVIAGSVMKAYDLTADAIRLRSKGEEAPTEKVKKVEKIRACFILSENSIVKAGDKDIYIRIAGPDGVVFAEATDDANSFDFEGKKILFSMKKVISYDNKSQDLCIYWDKKRTYKPGLYTVDVFTDGCLIGNTTFTLE